MIELKSLPYKEQLLIKNSCERFFLTLQKKTAFRGVYDQLNSLFTSNLYSKEVWMIITAASKALRYGCVGSDISLYKQHYLTANKITKLKLNLDRTKHVLSVLEDHGYLVLYKGYFNNKTYGTPSLQSCFLMEAKFIALFDGTKVEKLGLERDPFDLVEIRDSKTKTLMTSLSGIRGVKDQRSFINSYNELLHNKKITMDGNECNVQYKRVFCDNLKSGGRVYSFGLFQTSKKEFRKTIEINNNPVTEVDLVSLHPRILYTLEGIDITGFDPYTPADLVGIVSRDYLKFSMMCLINCKSVRSAKNTVWNKLSNKEEYSLFLTDKSVNSKYIDILVEHNKKISHYFNEDMLWSKLQWYDSTICEYVIKYFIGVDKAILPWHDSFVVCTEDQAFLISCMKNSWLRTFGTDLNFKYRIEF